MNNTIYNIILQLIFKNKITIEEVNGNEAEIVNIVNKAQVEGLKRFVAIMSNNVGGACLTEAEEVANDYIVEEIKKLSK